MYKLKNTIFNTPFEMELRIILLMSNVPRKFFSADRILVFDFMACYGKEYNISDINLHGDNHYMYGEIANRSSLLYKAIKNLVVKGYIFVALKNGYQYYVSDSGIEVAKRFSCKYANTYINIVKNIAEKYDKCEDIDLINLIQRYK